MDQVNVCLGTRWGTNLRDASSDVRTARKIKHFECSAQKLQFLGLTEMEGTDLEESGRLQNQQKYDDAEKRAHPKGCLTVINVYFISYYVGVID